MYSAYDEAQRLGYNLSNLIDAEMNKVIQEDPKDLTISKEFQAAYFYGMMTAFKRSKEIIEDESSKDMCELKNDSYKLNEMEDELIKLRAKVKELENK